MSQINTKQKQLISIWLGGMCFLVIFMVFLGGLTRLTNSGLSITEWKPLTGIVPPIDDVSWQIEFDKYKNSPEYIKVNHDIGLSEFKFIYIMEFVHRIVGRLTGIFFTVPLLFFLVRGHIRIRESGMYLVALLLLIGQGFMGWHMVKSGLVSDPHVSHYRLAAHLMLAVFLYMTLFWQFMQNTREFILISSRVSICRAVFWCRLSILVLLLQIIFGAFVAGLDAGLVYNSFPLMGDSFVPDEVSLADMSLASFSEPVFVQFIHRVTAYLLSVVIIVFCLSGIKLGSSKLSMAVSYVFVALVIQVLAGIGTVVYSVPIEIALIHQLGAILLLSCLLWAYFLLKSADN
ncbi:MAG: COX15/CtaA family protein [Rickettsiaceae bacterium]